VFLIVQERFK